MKKNILSIEIRKTPAEVFEFTTNPLNTPKWIDSIIYEEVDGAPIKMGSIYRNKNKDGKWTSYKVSNFKMNELFELTEVSGSYLVRYTYSPLKNGGVRLTYNERDDSDLKKPFKLEVIQKLKNILEEKHSPL